MDVKVWKEMGAEVLVLALVLVGFEDFGGAETLELVLGGMANVLAGPVL